MAIGNVPTWLQVNPSDFVRAGSAGAEAGLGAARVAQEAAALKQRAAQEAARLSHAEHLQSMELQARQEIAEQNRLREDQQMALQNAYRTSQIGLGKARIAQAEAIADQKAREAAMQFADEQGLAGYLKENPNDIIGGVSKFSRSRPSVVSTLTHAQKVQAENERIKKGAYIKEHPEIPGLKTLVQTSGNEVIVERPPKGLTPQTQLAIKNAISRLEQQKRELFGPNKKAAAEAIDKEIESYKSFGKDSASSRLRYDPQTGALTPAVLNTDDGED
jgi:hypothetical protein